MHCHVASLRNRPVYVFTCFWIRQLENNEAISPFVEFLVHGTEIFHHSGEKNFCQVPRVEINVNGIKNIAI